MDFFIKDDNIRPGNRGGRDQFKWDDVRMMNNKDRESYLGVSQSIGFLDKGGKWRKRDWWQSFKPDNKINRKKINEEREKIKQEEEQLLMNAIYGGNMNMKNYTSSLPTSNGYNQATNNDDKKLTDFQWEKIMKKNSSKVLSGNSINMYDYYDDDKHRAGLGVKTTVSFRTNPYEKNEDLGKLNGINIDEDINNKKKEKKDIGTIKKEKKDKSNSNSISHSNNILDKYIEEYVSRKKRSRSSSKNSSKKKEHKHRKHHHHRKERSRSRNMKKHSK